MPFKIPVFKNSQLNTVKIEDVKSVQLNNENEVIEEYRKGTVPTNLDPQNTKNLTVFTSLENIAEIPLEEAHQPQENVAEKEAKVEIAVDQIDKENIQVNVKTKVVKKTVVKGAKANTIKPKKISTKKDKINNVKRISLAPHKVRKPQTMFRNTDSTVEQSDWSQESLQSSQNSHLTHLSLPPSNMNLHQRLLWLQERREAGLWARCDNCEKWRYLPHVHDPTTLPELWYCEMNPDKRYNSCSIAEKRMTAVAEEQDVIHNKYTAGSVVWARLAGYPWWPAMVDDCVETELYYWLDGFGDIPNCYNVVFFDSEGVTRCWLTPKQLRPFKTAKVLIKNDKYRNRIMDAKRQATEAEKLGITERLKKFSFISRFTGPILSPKLPTKHKIRYDEMVHHRGSRKHYSNSESDMYGQNSETSGNGDNRSKYVKMVFLDSETEPSEKELLTPTKSQDRYGCKNITPVYRRSQSDISNRAVVCGGITRDIDVSKISNRAVFGDYGPSTVASGTMDNDSLAHGAISLAILEEAKLMGTANTDSTWQSTTSHYVVDNEMEQSYDESLSGTSHQQTQNTFLRCTRDHHYADTTDSENYQF